MEISSEQRPGGTFEYVRDWAKEWADRGWWHSFELPGGRRIDGVCDLPGLKNRLSQFPIPEDLRGKRALDIGTWDGWFAFELERRGAAVVAIDCWDNPRFREVHRLLGSSVDYRQMDVYELTPETLGKFDVVLFMGVLYHLKHPLLALECVCALTTDLACVDSFVLREKHWPNVGVENRPVMEFYETDEFGGQTDNWVAPTVPCLLAYCRTAGFAQVELRAVLENGACIACRREWPEAGTGTPPKLFSALNSANFGLNFRSHWDEYVACWFECPDTPSRADVRPEVSGLGVIPIQLSAREGRWQVTFKLPPGLAPGWHDVRLRVGESAASNSLQIAVDIPLTAGSLAITGVADSTTWSKNQIELNLGASLAIWVQGLPANADRTNVGVALAGIPVSVLFVAPAEGESPRQVNVRIPPSRGTVDITVSLAGKTSDPVGIQIIS